MREFYKKHWGLILNFALLIATLLIAFIAFKLIIPYFLPFLIGLVLAVAIEPLVRLFCRLNLSRPLAASLAMLIAVGVISAFSWLAISRLTLELFRLLANTSEISAALKSTLDFALAWVKTTTEGLPPEIYLYLSKNTEIFIDTVSQKISFAAGEMLKLIIDLPSQMLLILIALITTYFVSVDLPKHKEQVTRWIPEEYRPKLKLIAEDIATALLGYVKAQIILASVTASIIFIGLNILKTNYIILLTILSWLLTPIPVIGPWVIFLPWVIYAILHGNNYLAAGLCILLVIALIVKHAIEPKVIGKNIGIEPLAVLVALYAGFKFLGAYGLILGPFVLITFNALQRAKAFAWIFRDDKNPPPKKSPPSLPK